MGVVAVDGAGGGLGCHFGDAGGCAPHADGTLLERSEVLKSAGEGGGVSASFDDLERREVAVARQLGRHALIAERGAEHDGRRDGVVVMRTVVRAAHRAALLRVASAQGLGAPALAPFQTRRLPFEHLLTRNRHRTHAPLLTVPLTPCLPTPVPRWPVQTLQCRRPHRLRLEGPAESLKIAHLFNKYSQGIDRQPRHSSLRLGPDQAGEARRERERGRWVGKRVWVFKVERMITPFRLLPRRIHLPLRRWRPGTAGTQRRDRSCFSRPW